MVYMFKLKLLYYFVGIFTKLIQLILKGGPLREAKQLLHAGQHKNN